MTILARENPALVGEAVAESASELGLPDFPSFMKSKTETVEAPKRPQRAVYGGPIELRQRAVDSVNKQYLLLHQEKVSQYESKKRYRDLLKPYAGDLAGYGAFLIENHPQAMVFFGVRRPFHLAEASRRLHTYVVGGSGSGKSESLKSTIWHYLQHEPDSAIIYIDPHSDMAEQVARFAPNRDNGRLAFIKPALNGTDYPGLNPFDIADKHGLTDEDAENFADDFIVAFKEILDGNLTEQMENVLQYTIPVIVKMQDTSVYDLIDFLRPRQKEAKATKGDVDAAPARPYLAEKYLRFARENFSNNVMLEFLGTQFEDDPGYVTTRNSLTTRLARVFGTTAMQALFKGSRTVRLEELIRAKKLVVFDLSDLKQAELVGKFILITLKTFATSQSKVLVEDRTPCHVIVDECQKFITESMSKIVQEARKYHVFLTLAQPVVGGKMAPEMLESVLTNSGTIMIGNYRGQSADILARTVGVPVDTIKALKTGQFVIHQREATPTAAIVHMPTNTLRNRAGMASEDWKRVLADQVSSYYRKPGGVAAQPLNDETQETDQQAPEAKDTSDPLRMDIDSLLN